MDELRGPNIQIVLHVKEGLGFGFLKTPFIVSGSLNGYMLETDPVVPSHAPIFDAELVWEAEKRRFRSLRVQNVPVKVEVFTMGTQGRKDKIGYLLLSLLGAQPCPSNKIVDVKHTWHRLLGVRSEGKCCHPQLLMSLSVEDRVTTPTPRNELRMFHSNEVAYPSVYGSGNPPVRSMLLTLKEYLAESKKTASSIDLQPKLLCDEGLIKIGDGKQLFVLGLIIGAVENLDLLLPEGASSQTDCYVTYSVFTHDVMTDRVSAVSHGAGLSAHFNQRSSLRLAADLASLGRYFTECPHLVTRVCAADRDIGICSMDLRKLVPTDNTEHFLERFCNAEGSLTIHERCFLLRCDESPLRDDGRRPFVDVELSLQYLGVKQEAQKPALLTARSATQLKSARERPAPDAALGCKSESCTQLQLDIGGYTNMAAANTARYKNAAGDELVPTNQLAELIEKMCASLAGSRARADVQVQCGDASADAGTDAVSQIDVDGESTKMTPELTTRIEHDRIPVKLEMSKSDTCITHNEKDTVKRALSQLDRDVIMQKFVDELEDWKEKQQELFKCQLKRKEDYHLELLAKEWTKRREQLESKLAGGVERCRHLAADLSRATDDFRLRAYRNTERERKLLDAKKGLETHYTGKYQELREASQKMEDDMNHQLKLKDMRAEELALKVQHLEKQIDELKHNMKNSEKEAESRYSGLTKNQTASLIQELRCLEEKLDSAVQSKCFFKEQWGRAVRELHLVKLATRRQMLTQLRHDRQQLADVGLDTDGNINETNPKQSPVDINRLKDDFYVDILANTPVIESHSMLSVSGPDGMDMFEDNLIPPKNAASEKVGSLIAARERLITEPNPDEARLQLLNSEIRSLLLNCGT